MNLFKNTKTTNRIAYTFSLFNFLSLFFLLIIINITYFFIWYNEQKEASLHDMDMKYSLFSMPDSDMEVEEFKSYLLERDTLIIPEVGETVCSPTLEKKIHNDIEMIEQSYFYNYEGKTYFIFSKYYEKVGEVKVLFDTTPYIKSQLIIIKISIVMILLFTLLSLFLAKIIAKRSLSSLIAISEDVKNINLENIHSIHVPGVNKNDEIRILAESTNKMLEKIKDQTANLKQFITDVSHEFKTPLMTMSSYLDVQEKKVEKSLLSEQDTKETFVYMKQNIKKLDKLLETLLSLARIEEGIEKVEKRSTQAYDFFHQKILGVQLSFKDTPIEVILSGKKDISYMIEESFLSIVFENILSNAIKFSQESKKIDVRFSKNGFEIQDYGQGIGTKEQEKIWNKFFKLSSEKSGFGIGLFLVKRICEILDWKIEVQSQKGKGTKFIISF